MSFVCIGWITLMWKAAFFFLCVAQSLMNDIGRKRVVSWIFVLMVFEVCN